MSHFTVLVIGDNHELQLAPFHEYECTGIDDQYVVDVDVTDEVLKEFNEPQRVVRLADGSIWSRWDDRLYTIPKKEAWGRNEFELPEGAEELEMTADEARTHGIGHMTMDAAGESWCGAKARVDGSFYNRTNPNKQWDWYQVGGRWTGYFKLKPMAGGTTGKPGLMTSPAQPGFADVVCKGDIDFEFMRDDAGRKAGALWDKARKIMSDAQIAWDTPAAGAAWQSWDSYVARTKTDGLSFEVARNLYRGQAPVAALKASNDKEFSWEIDDDLAGSRDSFVQAARDHVGVPYAVVRDGQWYSKGKMGWWGVSTGDLPQSEWNQQVSKMLDDLPDETLLTIVDCHI